jgi:hypothetical protein
MSDDDDRVIVELRPLTPELEGEVGFGPENPDFGDRKIEGSIAKNPIARLFREVLEEGGQTYQPTALDEEYALWLVPHRLSVALRSNWAAVTAVGLDVEYDAGGATCSIVQLWPAAQYRLDASLLVHIGSQTSNTDTARLRLRVGTLEIALGEEPEVTFTAGVARAVVSAMGVGSQRCTWELLYGEQPLAGRDIETWSLLLLPKGKKTLKYRIRAWACHRTVFVPTRIESGWVDVNCKLIRGSSSGVAKA